MTVTFTKSFERSLKTSDQPELVRASVKRLLLALEEQVKPEGLGLKKLRADLWEIRVTRAWRVIFLMRPGEVRLVLVGDHDAIQRYLKHNA